MIRDEVLVLTNTVDKRCSHCGRTLPIGRFYRKKAAVDGFQAWCCDCQRMYKEVRSIESYTKEKRLGEIKVSQLAEVSKTMPMKDKTDLSNMLTKIARIIRTR